MLSRKRAYMEQIDTKAKKRTRVRVELLDCPPVNSINDLIEIGKSLRFYKNLDIVMLWRIIPYLQELEQMIGMDLLKQTLFYQIIYYLQGMHNRNKNDEYLHSVIYGSPGCGKTTVAKIIAKLYQAMGILSENGLFKTATRDDLVAGYLGQTSIKTKKLLNSCLGGVLFIDEAYSLAPRDSDRDSFSKECIDTLNAFLSEHKSDFCCIIAGYENEIKNCFFNMNQGLERRFPWVHRIAEYSYQQLTDIFLQMVTKINWSTNVDKENLNKIFKDNKELFKFAGGDVETFLSKCKMFHAKRVFTLSKEHKYILSKRDIDDAIEYLIKNQTIKEDKAPDHFYI